MTFPYTPQQLEWIEALESRDYKQATRALHTEEGYCCLGVACDLDDPTWESPDINYRLPHSSGEVSCLPLSIITKLQLRSPIGANIQITNSLASLNDSGHSLIDIACILRKNPADYFTNKDAHP